VQVQVRIGGVLRERLGQRRTVALKDGATVADLLRALAGEAGVPAETLERVAVARAGTIVPATQPLAAGDELSVVAPVAGG
jgi:molybdopterin converting factor small subunit